MPTLISTCSSCACCEIGKVAHKEPHCQCNGGKVNDSQDTLMSADETFAGGREKDIVVAGLCVSSCTDRLEEKVAASVELKIVKII